MSEHSCTVCMYACWCFLCFTLDWVVCVIDVVLCLQAACILAFEASFEAFHNSIVLLENRFQILLQERKLLRSQFVSWCGMNRGWFDVCRIGVSMRVWRLCYVKESGMLDISMEMQMLACVSISSKKHIKDKDTLRNIITWLAHLLWSIGECDVVWCDVLWCDVMWRGAVMKSG